MDSTIATFISSYLVLAIVLSAGFGLLAGWLAKQRGRSAGKYFALSFFFSFLIAVIVLLALPNLNTESTPSQTPSVVLEKCPNCAEMINSEANVCRFCQRGVSEDFSAIRVARAESKRMADQKRALLAKESEDLEALLAKGRRELEEERRARSKALLRSPKLLIPSALGVIVVIALVVMSMVSQVNANAEKKAVAAQKHTKEVELALSNYAEFMKHTNWTDTLIDCKKRFPSADLISESGSATGDSVKVRFRLTAKGAFDSWVASPSLQKNFNCFKYYYPATDGSNLSDPFSTSPIEAANGGDATWTSSGSHGRIFFTGAVKDLSGGDYMGSGPFEVSLIKDSNYSENVKAEYLEFLPKTK
jgi:hypothetical protein